jgi:hypothetical protein
MIITPATTPAHPSRRPFGLNAIIVLQILTVLVCGFALALVGIVLWMPAGPREVRLTIEQEIGVYEVLMLGFTLVVNVLCAVGLWRRRRWAWLLTMLQLGFFMLEDMYNHFTGAPREEYVWSMLLNVLMVFYLNQREVQAVFAPKNRDAASTDLLAPAPRQIDQGGAPQ